MSSLRKYALRCPSDTSNTLVIPISFTRNNVSFTNDSRSIHFLKMSLFIVVGKQQNPDEVICWECLPNIKPTKNGYVRVPDFGYAEGKMVWLSPQALHSKGKFMLLQDLPRAVARKQQEEKLGV